MKRVEPENREQKTRKELNQRTGGREERKRKGKTRREECQKPRGTERDGEERGKKTQETRHMERKQA